MNSREIVRRCIEFKEPPRIGLHFQTASLQGRVWEESDFAGVGYRGDPRFDQQPGQKEWVTEWGVMRRTIDTACGEAVGFPLAEGWHRLDTYRLPDFSAPWRYAHLAEAVVGGRAAGRYIFGNIPSLMLLPIDLRGMENWFMDNVLEQDNLARLMDRIVEADKVIIENYAAAGVDGVITWDDMGSNDRVLVSPTTFRELYLPRYKRVIDLLHERGMHFIHHCCGQVREYVEMFIEAKCDVLQLDQPELMGIDWLGEHCGGRICFWNCVDIQKTIANGDLDAIEDEAHRQIWRLGNFGGGFMVKAYQIPDSIGMTIAEVERQMQAFKKYAKYPLIPYRTNAENSKDKYPV